MTIRDFRNLNVYQAAFESALRIFTLGRAFPTEERCSLTDQIRRSARSMCINIAEAWRKGRYLSTFVSKLSDADAEAAETAVLLDMASKCGYLKKEAHKELVARYDRIFAQLVTMMNAPQEWCSQHEKKV
jgi:four helix bundle protein